MIEGLDWCPISEVDRSWLERPFEEEEIRRVVFSLDLDKSPGQDDFTSVFFKEC